MEFLKIRTWLTETKPKILVQAQNYEGAQAILEKHGTGFKSIRSNNDLESSITPFFISH